MGGAKKQFFAGISIQSVITLLMGIMELLVFSLMSRLLSKTDFGYFAALSGIVTICTSITEAGLGSSIIQKKDASQGFISTAFTLSWIFGIFGALLLFIFAPVIADVIADLHLTLPLQIMSINVFLACVASSGKSILIRNLQFKTYGTFEVFAYVFSATIGVALAFLGYGLYAIVSVSVINLILLNLIMYLKSVRIPRFKIVKSEIGGIVSFGGWLTLSVVCNNITQQMDRLVLPKWMSVTTLGAYNRPAGFVSTITGKINGIFDMVLFPMLSKMQDDPKKVQAIFIQALKLLNSFSAILFAIFFFNATLIIRIFFGTEWLELSIVLQIISVFIIFNIDNRLADCFFRSLGLVKIGFYLRIVSAVVTFSCLFFGSKIGLYGVAVSLVIANVFTVIMKVCILAHKIKVSFSSVFLSFIIAQKPLIPLLLIGIPFLMIEGHTLFLELLFAFIMALVILGEVVIFPKVMGNEYMKTVYPIVENLKNTIRFKR